jgi:hypothetical protein
MAEQAFSNKEFSVVRPAQEDDSQGLSLKQHSVLIIDGDAETFRAGGAGERR